MFASFFFRRPISSYSSRFTEHTQHRAHYREVTNERKYKWNVTHRNEKWKNLLNRERESRKIANCNDDRRALHLQQFSQRLLKAKKFYIDKFSLLLWIFCVSQNFRFLLAVEVAKSEFSAYKNRRGKKSF